MALTTAAPVMAFIKGTPDEPKCKFSRQLVAILREAGTAFGSFDVLSSPAVRAGLKDFSNWPTFPQLYVNGTLVGGVDIVQELKDSGELAAVLPTPLAAPQGAGGLATVTPSTRDRVTAAVSSAPAVLLMKGTPASPACGFSEQAVGLLQAGRVPFSSFDVIADPILREGAKAIFGWPTYPALFVGGLLIGGVGALKELGGEDGAGLLAALRLPASESLRERLTRLSTSAPVVLFMKGSAANPQCGFSARTIDMLASAGVPVRGAAAAGVFASVDILSAPDVRAGMKDFSNWPTFPQLYVAGEFVGGCDIITEMAGDGSLRETVAPVLAAAVEGVGLGHSHGGVACSGH